MEAPIYCKQRKPVSSSEDPEQLEKKKACLGLPWWSSSYNWALLLLGPGSIPSQGTKIPQDVQHGQKRKKKKKICQTSSSLKKQQQHLFSFFCLTTLHVGSQFSDQALNLCALQQKFRVLTTAAPGKAQHSILQRVRAEIFKQAPPLSISLTVTVTLAPCWPSHLPECSCLSVQNNFPFDIHEIYSVISFRFWLKYHLFASL